MTTVEQCMTRDVLTVSPQHSLRDVSRLMTDRRVGAAIVLNPERSDIGIITERDVLHALADGVDPDREPIEAHETSEIVYATPSWTLEDAAAAMIRGARRHLVVIDEGRIAGMISVRDIVREWAHRPEVV
jgi:signal-transduction protein with cAMP-binding, CBS, and nucleotidyltransferase domain